MPWVTENKYIYCTYIWAQHRISYFCSIHVPALGLEANGDRLGGVYNGLLGMGVVKGTGLLDHWGESSLMVTFQHITMNPWILHVLYKQATFIKSLSILIFFLQNYIYFIQWYTCTMTKKNPFHCMNFVCTIHTGNIHKNTNNAEFSKNIFFSFNDTQVQWPKNPFHCMNIIWSIYQCIY